MSERPQSFANHRRFPPLAYTIAGAVLGAEVAFRAWAAIQDPRWAMIWSALVAVALVVVWYESRRRAQIVQDRVIRLEMRLRLERLLGAARRADIARLSLPDLVGLRFASDAELPALVDEVLAGKFAKQDEIKLRVKDWQADWLRV
jgi:hypothetical protein